MNLVTDFDKIQTMPESPKPKSVKIGLVQINWDLEWQHSESAKGSKSVSFHFLPYSVGLLQAYAQRYLDPSVEVAWLPQIYSRLDTADCVNQLVSADIVGFSVYVWNSKISLEIARRLKGVNPDILVVFGGPHVPDRAEMFLRENTQVDVACHGEGESIFTSIIEAYTERNWTNIPSVSYLTAQGDFVTHPKSGRTKELSQIPSPYLEGTFDTIIRDNPHEQWVMAWETNRGCPFSCTFCDWGSATQSRVYTFDMDRLEKEINWAAENKISSIICCDANFGMLPRDLEVINRVIDSRKNTGYPYAISIQNAKNATERSYEIQKLLAENMRTIGVTLSLQTTNKETLKNIRRANIRSESFRELQRRFTRDGIYTYSDLILGLPGETYAEFADSISQVIDDGQHNHIQFHNCSILPNAEMGDPSYIDKYGLKTIPQPIRSVYSPIDDIPEIEEYLDTVIATDAMPASDWVRAKVLSWLTDLLHFDRLMQIPFMILHNRIELSYRVMIEAISNTQSIEYPTLGWSIALLSNQAQQIQGGGLEFFQGGPGGPLLWPGDQYLYIALVAEGKIDDFYAEAARALKDVVTSISQDEDEISILEEAIELNRALLRLPYQNKDTFLVQSHDILGAWKAISNGSDPDYSESLVTYKINRVSRTWNSIETWAEFLTWCQGRDKREYLYDADYNKLASSRTA